MNLEHISLDDIIYKDILNDRDEAELLQSKSFVELMYSISENGLLQPICVTENDNGTYNIFFGKRRFLAFKYLKELDDSEKYSFIPAVVLDENEIEKVPREMKILHENNFRDDIKRENYLESSLRVLPKFIDGDSALSLKSGIEILNGYVLFHNKEESGKFDKNFIAVDKFFDSTKTKIEDYKQYLALLKEDEIHQNLFFQNLIHIKDIPFLRQIKKNVQVYKTCINFIEKSSSKKSVSEFLTKVKIELEENKKEVTIKLMSNHFRKLKRVAKDAAVLNNEEIAEVQRLFLEIEQIFKNKKEK